MFVGQWKDGCVDVSVGCVPACIRACVCERERECVSVRAGVCVKVRARACVLIIRCNNNLKKTSVVHVI